jgi:hypothetical protein
MKPKEMISSMVSLSGEGIFLNLDVWSLKPLYQYCWFWRGMQESHRWSVIFDRSEERMVMSEYWKPR